MGLSLPQRLAVAKFLTELLARLRGEELVPEAVAEWAPGARIPVKFGDDLAGWASVPKPAVRASVNNKTVFLAWVKKHHPHQVQTVEQPYESFTKAILDAAKKNGGYWIDADTGEKHLIPGITVGTGDPYVKVDLADDAGDIIARAWRAGDVDFGELLAIEGAPARPAPASRPAGEPHTPAPETPPSASDWELDIVTTLREGRNLFMDEHGFLGPEAAAAHACIVQGGFSTPPIEAYRMIRSGGVDQERALAWLTEHGLDPEDPRQGKDTPWPLPKPGEAA